MADVTPEQMQQRITAARREAEGLKDRIKRKKDELADTTRKPFKTIYHLNSGRLHVKSTIWQS
jgi:thymidylate kinase